MQLQQEEKNRLRRLLLRTGILLAVGIGYAIFVAITDWRIPCLLNVLTGAYCPGCGITRMFMALFRLDFAAAAQSNLLTLCLLPVGAGLFVYKARCYIRKGSCPMAKWEKWLYLTVFILCIAFTILRNSGQYPFLLPK